MGVAWAFNPFTYQLRSLIVTNFRLQSASSGLRVAASAPSVRHGVVTSEHPSSKSVMLAPPTVRVLAQQPMQEHAPTRASQTPPPCLQQVQVSKSGSLLLAQSHCIRLASAQPREATVVPVVGLHNDHHHRVLRVYGVQVRAPILSSM